MTTLVALILVVALGATHWLSERHHRGPERVHVPIRDRHRDDRG